MSAINAGKWRAPGFPWWPHISCIILVKWGWWQEGFCEQVVATSNAAIRMEFGGMNFVPWNIQLDVIFRVGSIVRRYEFLQVSWGIKRKCSDIRNILNDNTCERNPIPLISIFRVILFNWSNYYYWSLSLLLLKNVSLSFS